MIFKDLRSSIDKSVHGSGVFQVIGMCSSKWIELGMVTSPLIIYVFTFHLLGEGACVEAPCGSYKLVCGVMIWHESRL